MAGRLGAALPVAGSNLVVHKVWVGAVDKAVAGSREYPRHRRKDTPCTDLVCSGSKVASDMGTDCSRTLPVGPCLYQIVQLYLNFHRHYRSTTLTKCWVAA